MALLKGDTYNLPHVSFGKVIFDGLRRHGDRICAIEEETGVQYTFREVLERTIKLSAGFKRMGFKKNDVVALITENYIDAFVVLISCLYNGYIVTLLSPDYTTYEYVHYLRQTEPKHLVCSERVMKKINEINYQSISFKSKILLNSNSGINVAEIINTTNVDVNNFEPEPFNPDEQVAFIYFSSGTTGLPKGVPLTHRNISMSLVQTGPKFLGANEDEVYLYNLPLFHVIALFPLSACFCLGAKLILFSKFNPKTFFTTIEKYNVSILTVVPRLVLFMIKSELSDNLNMGSLKQVFCGTAPITPETIALFQKKYPCCSFHQMYGLTETSAAIVINPLENKTKYGLGVVIDGNEAKIVDVETREIVGPNVLGELCFRGMSVTKGYLKNEEANMKSFDEDGFFMTGDIGYYDEEGFVFASDRIKDIIKYKGFQVSPTEIESVLLTMDAIREAAVIGVEDEKVGEVPFAYVVCADNNKVTKEEIHEHVSDHLSENKYIRGGIEFISALPKSTIGKTDKKALKMMYTKKYII